jgi:hypothetical protein
VDGIKRRQKERSGKRDYSIACVHDIMISDQAQRQWRREAWIASRGVGF